MSVQDPVDVNATNKQVTVDSVTNWQLPLLAILFVSIVFVAIKTVVQRHESRTAYMKLQTLEKERDKLAAQWSRLKLEQGTALNQVRVEQYARWDLKMKIPKASEIRIVREPQAAVDAVVSNQTMIDHDKLSKVSLSD
ncbi:cell division protein FtsL [Cocleimonas sp. KMM 6892]|uniref:cell division protein FtsL n=1 Tax=unclassified Cocleimonas TaxID=2639732 RepID=UPI002DB56A2D|nr:MULTISPECIES: cell division protein FtsL [unclassified Cocleimonas]MEB8430614.1 cell division protein FtsL [Cocleimonas sp. KMM 6892]MEC4716935.1 cell division protein FtsL [Cocleimonas sp. KMM 6895]MEC4743947.1 cell division protein FtsL [Cocleimonas sp. KMM 6896]